MQHWVQIAGTDTLVAGPFESAEQAQAEIAAKAISRDGYTVVAGTEGKDILPPAETFKSSRDYYEYVNGKATDMHEIDSETIDTDARD